MRVGVGLVTWSLVTSVVAPDARSTEVGCDGAMPCLARFVATGDPLMGARAARALEDLRIEDATIGWIAEQIGDRPGGADAWNALGDVHRHARRNPEAIAAYRRALDHRSSLDLRGRIHDAVGLYNRLTDEEDYLAATEYCALAYSLATELGDRHERAYVLAGVVNIIYDLGDLPLARQLADEASEVIDEGDEYWHYLLGTRASIDLALGHDRTAEAEAGRAIAASRSNPQLAHWRVQMELTKAWIQTHAGELDAAAATLGALELDSTDPYLPELQARLAMGRARIAVERGDLTGALEILDAVQDAPLDWVTLLDATRGRALARVPRVADAEAVLVRTLDRIDIERAKLEVDSLKPWVLAWQREPFEDLFELLVAQGRAGDALAVVQRATARSLLDGLVAQATTDAPSIGAQLQLEGERVSALRKLARSLRSSAPAVVPRTDELAARLSDRTVATYFRAGPSVYLVMLSHGVATARRLGSVAAIEHEIAVADRAALGARLIPTELLPPHGEPLYVAIDPPLQHVSFAALQVEGRYLVERNPIAYVPSASVLAAQLARPQLGTGAVVVGDSRSNLPAALAEATSVARDLGVRPALGQAATRAAVLAARGKQLLHVAGHAEVTPAGAALRMADGPLTAGEIVDAGATATTVVLMSCASADPLDRDELGPLANAFVAAGARAVVAARWSVRDDDAAAFVRAFYLAGGARDPIHAVAQSQRQMIARGVADSIWSTFVVVGSN